MPGLPFEYHTRVHEFAKSLLGVDQLTEAQQTAVEHWNTNDQQLEEYLKKHAHPPAAGLPRSIKQNHYGDGGFDVSSGDTASVDIVTVPDDTYMLWTVSCEMYNADTPGAPLSGSVSFHVSSGDSFANPNPFDVDNTANNINVTAVGATFIPAGETMSVVFQSSGDGYHVDFQIIGVEVQEPGAGF